MGSESVIMNEVLQWVWKDFSEDVKKEVEKFKEKALQTLCAFLEKNVEGFLKIMKDVAVRGYSWAIEKLKVLKDKIKKVCKDNQQLTESMLKLGTKATCKAVAGLATKRLAAKVTTEVVEKTVKVVVIKHGTRLTTRAGSTVLRSGGRTIVKVSARNVSKTGLKSTLKAAANPVGIVSDVAQAGLEMAGQKEVGKAVGAAGNIASGAMTGFVIGGPVGAGVGAAAGYGLWFFGEVVGELFERAIS